MNGMCVSFTTIACALRWGVTLVGVYLYWALAHPVVGPPLQVRGECRETTLIRGRCSF